MTESKEEFLRHFSPALNGLKGQCPRCRKTTMFGSFLKIKKTCDVCGLDYGFAGPADGPSFFAMSTMMLISCVWVAVMKVKFDVSGIFIITTTLPLLVIGTVLLLRYFRGLFVSAEYFIKVRDGRLSHSSH